MRDAAATAGELGLSISGLLPRSLYKIYMNSVGKIFCRKSLDKISEQDLDNTFLGKISAQAP